MIFIAGSRDAPVRERAAAAGVPAHVTAKARHCRAGRCRPGAVA